MKLPTSSARVSIGIPPKPTRLRSISSGAVRLAIHLYSLPQGNLAKANKDLELTYILYVSSRFVKLICIMKKPEKKR
jgi:hypothetical protein